jgi:glycosyltransferase involved in cell wall biosynthesis
MRTRRILFYASVKDVNLFSTQQFYVIDINLLKESGFDVRTTNRIRDFLFFWDYDLSFIYFYRYGLFAAIVAKFLFKKVYFTGGIDDLDENFASAKNYRIQKILFKLCYFFSDHCFIVSSSDANNISALYKGALPLKVSVSKHVIEIEKFKTEKSQIKEDIFTTIAWMETISNVKRKGIDLALVLFKHLIEIPGFEGRKFYIIGKEGSGSEFLRNICRDLDLSDNVIFTGNLSEPVKIDLLKRSKYYFQLSKYEGFGLAALEALASHNIVIHSGCGGLKDSIGTFGIFCDISKEMKDNTSSIYEKMLNFDNINFIESDIYINNNFSRLRRKKDFQQIIF